MSSTWRELSDHGQTRVAPRRLSRRVNNHRASLALPAVVMSVLGGAFVVWFMTGAHQSAGAGGLPYANTVIRPAVQTPQIATTPALEASAAEPAQTPPISVLIAAMTAAAAEPEAAEVATPDSSMMPLALQPTRQITTPAPMTAVVSDAQQISAPRIAPPIPMPPAPLERRLAQAPPPAPQLQTALAPPAPVPPPKAAPAVETAAAEPERPTRVAFAAVLASVETEGEARAKVGQMKQKFSAILGSRRLNYHRAKQDGAYVWHVRSAGLTEADAEAVCAQIEKAGGECSAVDQ